MKAVARMALYSLLSGVAAGSGLMVVLLPMMAVTAGIDWGFAAMIAWCGFVGGVAGVGLHRWTYREQPPAWFLPFLKETGE